jgi:hypothetical protein
MNPWVILGVVLAIGAAAGAGFYKGHESGSAGVQQKWDRDIREREEQYAKDMEKARTTESEIRADADKRRVQKDLEIRAANASLTALRNIVRDRADRPQNSEMSGNTGSGPTPTGCTGSQLYRPDGEFLAGEAAAARECQSYLRECRDTYEIIKQKLQSQ